MKNGILIEPIINGKAHGFAIQARKFSMKLRILNMSDSPSKEFTLSNVHIESADGQDITDDFNGKSYFVDKINPNESQVIDIGNNGTFMRGLTKIKATIKPETDTDQIQFLQKNPFTNEICEIGLNKWIDFFYIKNSSEHSQERTTKTIIILTWVTAILSIIQVISIFSQ